MSRKFSLPGDDKLEIDEAAVLDFFEKRAEKVKILGPSRAVIYQDKNPKLAELRDAAEKALLYPMIQLDKEARVLDAGCGTGRWAELIIPACGYYHGVDVSPSLIEVAKQHYDHFPNARFSVCSLDKVSLNAISEVDLFSHILSFGIYIYLNDDAAIQSLRRISTVAAKQARILFREPVSVRNRLTLKEHFSEDMDQYYSAIYRTEAELLEMFDATIVADGFQLLDSGDVYADSELNNRADTKQRWYLWER